MNTNCMFTTARFDFLYEINKRQKKKKKIIEKRRRRQLNVKV